jgi:hypothetical protein
MSKAHKAIKYNLVKEHRKLQYEIALDRLIEGKVKPDYPNERFNKLKEIR